MKLVINKCFGGFGLSDAGYEKLIEWGVPVRKYVKQERGKNGLYEPQPLNDGEIIFDRELTPPEETDLLSQRYWETWLDGKRDYPLLVRVVEELGEKANGRFAKLSVVEIPDGTDYEVQEYDGLEHIAEVHRTWS